MRDCHESLYRLLLNVFACNRFPCFRLFFQPLSLLHLGNAELAINYLDMEISQTSSRRSFSSGFNDTSILQIFSSSVFILTFNYIRNRHRASSRWACLHRQVSKGMIKPHTTNCARLVLTTGRTQTPTNFFMLPLIPSGGYGYLNKLLVYWFTAF